MSASKLVKPHIDYKESFLEALDEYHAEGRYQFLERAELDENFEQFVEDINNNRRHLHKPYEDWVEPVPETALWMVKEDKYIGTFNIRHRLNWHLEKWGGHINFIIRPSMRAKGFGKKILQKGIPYICYMGVERGLLTVNPDNAAAIRVIEFCGGQYDDEAPETDKFPARKRYWLDCG